MILSIVGKSGSGKTTLIEEVVPKLIERGLKVGVIKHAKKGFEIDREGKDSHRIFQSGADVAIISKDKLAVVKRVNTDSIEECIRYFYGYDLILTEGFSEEKYPKIVVTSGSVDREYNNVVAVVDSKNLDIDGVVELILTMIKKYNSL